MSSQPHLQIVNPSQSTQSEGSSFSPFPLLPKELRLNIWRHALQRHRIIQISPLGIEYRFLVAYDPTLARIQISDRESAKQWLQQDEDLWNGLAPKEEGWPDLKWPVGAEHEDWKNEDLEKAVRPAFGFWLFPLEALGPLREEGVPKNKGFRSRGKVILDMTDYWPELALTSLP
ncbi:hypothetical protein P7C71_g1171, partial [Lecanoromycetidae sp. Uapishka_2]